MKQKLYLDTSVPSAYSDTSMPERNNHTRIFWNKLKNYEVFISDLVINEISHVIDNKLRKTHIFPNKYRTDAIHVAVSTVNNLDILVSWNFEHLVKVKTKHLVNLINLEHGYKQLEIIAPPEL